MQQLDDKVRSAGFGICAAEPAGMHYAPSFHKEDTNWQLPLQPVNWTGKAGWWPPEKKQMCAIVDLNNVTLPRVPAAFNFCMDAPLGVLVLVQSNDRWMAVTNLYAQSPYSVVRLSKRAHGWNYGYSSVTTDIFSATTPLHLKAHSIMTPLPRP